MKKIIITLLLFFVIFLVSSCEFTFDIENNNTITTPNTIDDNNDNNNTITTPNTIDDNNNENNNKNEMELNYEYIIPTDLKFDDSKIDSAYIKTVSLAGAFSGSYDRNFLKASQTKTINNIDVGAYRYKSNSKTTSIYPDESYFQNTLYHGKEGSIFNVNSLGGIDSLKITYSTDDDSKTIVNSLKKPNVTFGKNKKCLDYLFEFELSSSNNTITINVNNSDFQYFSINTGSYVLSVTSFVVQYDDRTISEEEFDYNSGTNKYRINPVKYSGQLIPGVSKVTIPLDMYYDENTKEYKAKTTKELTYYTYEYVLAHKECVKDATITDPLLVCAYYTAFNIWPANYDFNKNNVKDVFGTDARQVSSYSKKTGYALSIPWVKSGYYYELDIDFDGTYSKTRGTGRVVVWDEGWNASGYDSSPVCVYTDDHYNTWLEYLNNGLWSNRFDAEGNATGLIYSNPITVFLTV